MIGNITFKGELTPSQTFPLKMGLNKIGRRTDPDQIVSPDEILINTDDVSIHRQYHCVVEVSRSAKGGYEYVLFPHETASNPTLLGKEKMLLQTPDQIYIGKGTVWQIGEDTTAVLNFP